jgi:hypothetical protein
MVIVQASRSREAVGLPNWRMALKDLTPVFLVNNRQSVGAMNS